MARLDPFHGFLDDDPTFDIVQDGALVSQALRDSFHRGVSRWDDVIDAHREVVRMRQTVSIIRGCQYGWTSHVPEMSSAQSRFSSDNQCTGVRREGIIF